MVKSAITLLKELMDSIKINENGTGQRDKKTTVTQRRSLPPLTNIHENGSLLATKRTASRRGSGIARYESTERLCTASMNHKSLMKKPYQLISRNGSRYSNTELSHEINTQPSKRNACRSRIPQRIKPKGSDLGVEEIHEVLDKMFKTIVPSPTSIRESFDTKKTNSGFIQNNLLEVPIQDVQESTKHKKENNLNKTYFKPTTPLAKKERSNFTSAKLINSLTPSRIHSNVPCSFISNETGLRESASNSKIDLQKTNSEGQIFKKETSNSSKKNYYSRGITPNIYIPTKSCRDISDKVTVKYKKEQKKIIEKNKEEFNKSGMVRCALPRYCGNIDLDLINSQKNHTTSLKLLKSMTRSKKFESTHIESSENYLGHNTPQLYSPTICIQYLVEEKKITDQKIKIPGSENYADASSSCDDLADVGTYEEFEADRLNRKNYGDGTIFENVVVGEYEDFERDLYDKDQRRLRGLMNSMFESGNIVMR